MDRTTRFCAPSLLLIAALSAHGDEPANPLDKSPSLYAKSGDMKIHYKSLGKG